MSLCSMIGLNIAVIPIIYALDHSNPMSYSTVFCQLQFYFRHSFNQMMRTFFVLACVDRYAILSNNRHIRSFSRYQVAIRLIPSVILFWLLLSIFPTMLYSSVNGMCDVISGLSVFPLVKMSTFELLMIINLKKIRARVRPIGNTGATTNILRKRDRDMMRMLLIELTTYTFTTTPYTIALIYRIISSTIRKNDERQHIESVSPGGSAFGEYSGGFSQTPGGIIYPSTSSLLPPGPYMLGSNLPSVDPYNYPNTVYFGPSYTIIGPQLPLGNGYVGPNLDPNVVSNFDIGFQMKRLF